MSGGFPLIKSEPQMFFFIYKYFDADSGIGIVHLWAPEGAKNKFLKIEKKRDEGVGGLVLVIKKGKGKAKNIFTHLH